MKKTKAAATPGDTRVLTAAEAQKRSRRSLEVAAGKTIELDEKSVYHARVQLASVADLKRMSFLHADLDEKRVLESVRADDDDALQQARRTFQPAACACGDQSVEGHRTHAARVRVGDAFRIHYERLRRQFHPNLAQQLSVAYRQDISWDSMLAVHSHRWLQRLRVKPFDIGVLVLADIVVGKNATLSITNASKLLLAHDVRIHTGGKIRTTGAYLKVTCNSIQGNLP